MRIENTCTCECQLDGTLNGKQEASGRGGSVPSTLSATCWSDFPCSPFCLSIFKKSSVVCP